jgi:hypothetical protein
MCFFYHSNIAAVASTVEGKKVELGDQPLLYFVSQFVTYDLKKADTRL